MNVNINADGDIILQAESDPLSMQDLDALERFKASATYDGKLEIKYIYTEHGGLRGFKIGFVAPDPLPSVRLEVNLK